MFFLWMLPGEMYAQETVYRNGFVLGGWLGYGQTDVKTENISGGSHGTIALGFKGGYAITPRIIVGVEANGWTLEAFDNEDPSRGESVSNVSLFANCFPLENVPLYVAGGAGRLSYTNNSPEVSGRDKGGSWFVGSGYEVRISEKLSFVPQVRYSQGNFTGGNFKVYELAFGINWYSGK